MKVIFLKDNTIKEVNDGYAQNYLLPNNIVKIATPYELEKRNQQLKHAKEQRKAHDKEHRALSEELDGKVFILKTDKIGKNGKLNGAITTKEISEKTQIDKLYLHLDGPIKEAGSHIVPLKIGQYHARITLSIEKEGV